MFRYLFRRFLVFLVVVAFLLGLLVYQGVHWNQPELPRTELSGLGLETYLYSAEKLPDASKDDPVSVSFSPEETSFLLENVDFTARQWGFTLEDVYLDSVEENIRVQMVLSGPFGFYYQSRFTGKLKYDPNSQGWSLRTNGLSLGPLPVGYFFTGTTHPDWPRTFADGFVTFRSLNLDGKGLRMTVTDFNFDLESLMD
jgi:hypothetical protein